MTMTDDDLLAEFAAIRTVALSAIKAIAVAHDDPVKYLHHVLEDGLAAVERRNYGNIPAERRNAFVDNVKARYADAITGIQLD